MQMKSGGKPIGTTNGTRQEETTNACLSIPSVLIMIINAVTVVVGVTRYSSYTPMVCAKQQQHTNTQTHTQCGAKSLRASILAMLKLTERSLSHFGPIEFFPRAPITGFRPLIFVRCHFLGVGQGSQTDNKVFPRHACCFGATMGERERVRNRLLSSFCPFLAHFGGQVFG